MTMFDINVKTNAILDREGVPMAIRSNGLGREYFSFYGDEGGGWCFTGLGFSVCTECGVVVLRSFAADHEATHA